MPTGYTAKLIESRQSFSSFALGCAKAFGACVEIRDSAIDSEIPVFKPSKYNLKKLKEAESMRDHLLDMSNKEKIEFGQQERSKCIKSSRKYLAQILAQNNRLNSMMAKVVKWNPPTKEHVGLKDFMLEQIKISMNDPSYAQQGLDDAKASMPRDYYDTALNEARRAIEYNANASLEEINRTAERNKWVNDLKASLL